MNDFDGDYEAIANRLQDFKVSVDPLIRVLLEIEGIQSHSVTSRIKSKASVRQKLQRPDKKRELNDLTDILGVRIITYFQDEVDAVAKLIEREFIVDRKLLSISAPFLIPTVSATSLFTTSCSSTRSAPNCPRTVPTKTLDSNYKFVPYCSTLGQRLNMTLAINQNPEFPTRVRRRFSRLAGLLELATTSFWESEKSSPSRRPRGVHASQDIKPEIQRILARPGLSAYPIGTRNGASPNTYPTPQLLTVGSSCWIECC